jgi:hypothetical protein
LPLISDNWTKQFNGGGMVHCRKRSGCVERTGPPHARTRAGCSSGRANNPNGWKELFEAGVDLLNTDKLAEMSEFLRKQ